MQQRYADYQKAVHERQALGQRQQADEQAQHAEWLKQERATLAEKLPSWSDPAVAQKDQMRVAEYLLTQGYQQADLENLTDHRALLIALDAAKWQEHQKTLTAAKSKQAKPTPGAIIKPGSTKTAKPNLAFKEARERLGRNPDSLEALGDLMHASRKR